MITLYGFGAGFGLPEISPFVTKTEVQLKMAGLAYRKEKAKPPASPKGQLPYIVDEAETIANSTFIRAHLEAKYGFDFDAPLSLQARAQAWAFERMIEHHVYWALVGARWVDGDNFAKGPAHFFDSAPLHLREKMREDAQFRVAENYLLSGLGRHAPEEDVDLAVRSLFALSVQLGDKPFLMGETPCGMDATAFGALAGILTPFFESPLRQRTEQFANLTAYVDRMMLLYYPEFAWAPVQQEQAALIMALPAVRGLALQGGQFRFEFGDAGIAHGERLRDIGGVEFLRDVLRAIGVPRRDPEQDDLLGPRLVALRHQRFRQRRIVFHHARLAPDLHAAAMRIIHHENMRLRILRQIALRDVLPVAAVIGERDACSCRGF